jgi:protein-tyrosine phosphatase
MSQPPTIEAPAGVLFLCLGNICRSPLAEGAMRAAISSPSQEARRLLALHDHRLLVIDSAGTGAWHAGEPPDTRSIRIARENGVDISNQRARQLTNDDFARFDWIVAMDPDNLETAGRRRPPGPRHQRARLVPFVDFVPGDAHTRPDRVPDPYYGDLSGFHEVWDLLMRGMPTLVAAVSDSLGEAVVARHPSTASTQP